MPVCGSGALRSTRGGAVRRLRRKHRLYLEEWVHLVSELHPDLTDSDARAEVHAAIGAIQSALFYASGLSDDRLRGLLTGAATAVLGCGLQAQPGQGREYWPAQAF